MGSISKKRNWAIFIFSAILVAVFFFVPYIWDFKDPVNSYTLYQLFFKNDFNLTFVLSLWGNEIAIIDTIGRIVVLVFVVSIAVNIVLNIIMAFGGHKSRFFRALQKIFYFLFGFVSLVMFLLCLFYPIQALFVIKAKFGDILQYGGIVTLIFALVSFILCILQFGACRKTKV